MKRPNLILSDREAALITECEGVFTVEPMRVLLPSEAKAIAKRRNQAEPKTHACIDCPTMIQARSTRCASCNMARVAQSSAAAQGRARAAKERTAALGRASRVAAAHQERLQHAALRKAQEDDLSPFERQERALLRGAGLQDNVSIARHSAAANELRQKLA